MASSHAPRKRLRSHAVAARSSVPKRAVAQRMSVDSEDDDGEEEMENESLGLEASDGENLTTDRASARRHALRQAEVEGLTLQPSDGKTGFKGVRFSAIMKSRPYQAHVWRRGKEVYLGIFATAEEAALRVARDIAANGAPALTAVELSKAKAAAAPAPLTAEAALRQAEVDGLTLQPSDNTAGYKGVSFQRGAKHKPYQAAVSRGGKMVTLGFFAAAEEAALCYTRDIAANGAPALSFQAKAAAAPAPLTAEEALRQARAEGLTLQPADNTAGFKNVTFHSDCTFRPFSSRVCRGDKMVHLGCFATAEEAALCYARDVAANGAPGPTGLTKSQAAAAAAPTLTTEEALRQAEVEGLTLQTSNNTAGFKGVSFISGKQHRPYEANAKRDGNRVRLGTFATAEEAALCYARDIARNGAPGLDAIAAAKARAAAGPAPLTTEEALQQAEVEGLTLQLSGNKAGFKGVGFSGGSSKPYQAQMRRGGTRVHLGYFATAEEAALQYARDIASRAAAAALAPAPPTAEEALWQAEAEGLTLQPSEGSKTGFKGVGLNNYSILRPYKASVKRGGKQVSLGSFATAEEAGLCYARHIATNGTSASAAPVPLTAEETLRQAEAEGLALQPSEESKTGFKGVRFNASTKLRPYMVRVRRGGKEVHSGCFATPEEAALCYARDIAANGVSDRVAAAAAAPVPLTAVEAVRQAEAEGMTLQPSDNTTGFKGVVFDSGRHRSKPYRAEVYRGGKAVKLGRFATAEEAALRYARDVAANLAPGPSGVHISSGSAALAPAPLAGLTTEEVPRHAVRRSLQGMPSTCKPSASAGDGFVGRDEAAEDRAEDAAEVADEEAAGVMVLVGEAVDARASDDDCMVVDVVRATDWLEPVAMLSNEDDEPLCPICCEAFTDTEWGRTPCGHAFHKACLREWTQTYANVHCPECRTGLSRSWRRTFTPEEGACLV